MTAFLTATGLSGYRLWRTWSRTPTPVAGIDKWSK